MALEFFKNSVTLVTKEVSKYLRKYFLLPLVHFAAFCLYYSHWSRRHQNSSRIPVRIPVGIKLIKAASFSYCDLLAGMKNNC